MDELRRICMNVDNEARILKDWQQALTDFHGNTSLTIPGVFVDSHLNWENTNEKQIFLEQTQILLNEIKSRQAVLDQRLKFYGRSRRFKTYGCGGRSLRPFLRQKVLLVVFLVFSKMETEIQAFLCFHYTGATCP